MVFCKNCGKELKDGARFCASCGAKVSEEVEQIQPVEPVAVQEPVPSPAEVPSVPPVVEDAPAEETVVEEPAAADPEATVPDEASVVEAIAAEEPAPKKKHRKFPVIPAVVAGVIVAAAVVVGVAFGDYVGNTFAKLFMSSDQYAAHVLKKNNLSEDLASGGAALLGQVSEIDLSNAAAKGSIGIEIGDGLDDLAKDTGAPNDLAEVAWLKNANIDYTVRADLANMQAAYDLTLGINNVDVFELDYILDANGNSYITMPGVNDQAILVPGQAYDGAQIAPEEFAAVEAVLAALPSEEKAKAMLVPYFDAIFAGISDVDESTEKVTAGGITQKITKLSFDIDEELAKNVVLNVLNEAKGDKELKQLIVDMAKAGNVGPENVDVDAMWSEIDRAIENLEEVDADGEAVATIALYVNGKGEIVGFEVEVEDADLRLTACTLEKGKKFGSLFEMEVDGEAIAFKGNGSTSGNKRSGDFTLEYRGLSVIEFVMSDIDTKLLEQGILNGSITMKLGKDAAKLIVSEAAFAKDLAIVFDFNSTSADKTDVAICLDYKNRNCVKLILTSEMAKAQSISLPWNYANSNDSTAMYEWFFGADTSSTTAKLRSAGVPKELIEDLEYKFDELYTSAYNEYYNDSYYSNFYDDYYNDYYDYYDYYG